MQFPDGIDRKAPYLLILSDVSNNGCQPSVKMYADYAKALGLRQVFTNYCNPKGDTDAERLIRIVKEELI
jgi:hypothetical protein